MLGVGGGMWWSCLAMEVEDGWSRRRSYGGQAAEHHIELRLLVAEQQLCNIGIYSHGEDGIFVENVKRGELEL